MIATRSIIALVFVINTVLGLYTAAVLLRFLMQQVRADFYNPLAQAVVKLTNPLLTPLRRVIRPWGKLDAAAIVLMIVVQFMNVLLVVWVAGTLFTWGYIVYWTVLKLVF
ncbi:MAG TPA: YggT family protein, partial [Gammaproteobacteria bacterium]|nr:YggT family protein [Gammaproteobacteria bacterium]